METRKVGTSSYETHLVVTRNRETRIVPVPVLAPGFGMVGLGKETCTRLNYRTLFKRTPVIGNNPIPTILRLNKLRPYQRRRRGNRHANKRLTQTEPAPRQTAWTTEEENLQLVKVGFVSGKHVRGKVGERWLLGEEILYARWQDKAKNKGSKASGSSTMNDDALARLMVTELTAAEVAQREKFMELKRREVECREREIAAAKYRALLKLEVPCTLTFELLGPLVLATAGANLNAKRNDGYSALYRVAMKGGNRLSLMGMPLFPNKTNVGPVALILATHNLESGSSNLGTEGEILLNTCRQRDALNMAMSAKSYEEKVIDFA
ncbi:hypothetical protein Tco_0961614 [Tanacetum coccineum]